MTRRKRLLRVFDRKIPDRVPIGMDCWSETRKRIYNYYGAKDHYDFYQKSGVDNFSLWDWPVYEPEYVGPARPNINGKHSIFAGVWGCEPEMHYPMEFDFSSYRWPKTSDFDFSCAKGAMLEAHTHDMVSIGAHISVGLTHHIRMRGYESTFCDVLDDVFMEDYTGRLREYYIGYLNALFASSGENIDIMRCDEDIGGNESLYISPSLWRRWYKPLWREMFDICHKHKCMIWLHSCGYCRPLIEDFIECGANVLDPVPPYVKDSDPKEIKAVYGKRLCLHGGVNQIDALVYGTPESVREETRLRMEQMKPGGGYICGASQVLTDQIPIENIAAFFEAAHEFGDY